MQEQLSTTITACRICDDARLENVIPLIICRCGNCGTIQLTETVSPEVLFGEYVWVTGTSQGARDYSQLFYERLLQRTGEKPLFVVEVASNDGTFLQRFRQGGHKVLGVDPARNIAAMAEAAGVPTMAEFFGLDAANQVVAQHGHADAVIARNVVPHVANANDVIAGIARCLKPDGVGAIEFHSADVILSELHYDSIYHEHLYYHSLHSLGLLLARHGLTPFDVTVSPISGGSLVVYFSLTARPQTAELAQAMAQEQRLGVGDAGAWRAFAERSARHREALRSLVAERAKAGKRVIGYGASARSSTMLNYCGIGHGELAVVADKNPLKHGRLTPGTDVRIVSPEDAFAEKPDAVLLLAWNFKDEILKEMASDRGWHGEVIVPLPNEPVVLAT
jgi:SAM-dependent methyltransferase